METDTTLYPLFEPVRAADESVRWAARPTLLPWIASGLPFLLVGLGWGALDYFGFIRNMKMTGDQATFMIIFFAFHLFPFWGSILYMFYLVLSHKNAAFAATDRRIIIRRGLFGVDYRSIPFDSLGNMEVATGPLHNLLALEPSALTPAVAATRDACCMKTCREFPLPTTPSATWNRLHPNRPRQSSPSS
jgi:Bacterial PH domain